MPRRLGRIPRPHEDPAGVLRRGRRHRGGGARQARQARQPGALRQRHRLAVDRARPRRLEVRSRRAAAGDSRKQRQQERPRARHRARASARTSPCASSRSGSAAIPAWPWSARPRPSPTRWRNGSTTEGLRRLHRACSRICPAGSTTSSTQRGAGIAAARPVPARIRGQDAARESRPAAAGEPVLLTAPFARIPVCRTASAASPMRPTAAAVQRSQQSPLEQRRDPGYASSQR